MYLFLLPLSPRGISIENYIFVTWTINDIPGGTPKVVYCKAAKNEEKRDFYCIAACGIPLGTFVIDGPHAR